MAGALPPNVNFSETWGSFRYAFFSDRDADYFLVNGPALARQMFGRGIRAGWFVRGASVVPGGFFSLPEDAAPGDALAVAALFDFRNYRFTIPAGGRVFLEQNGFRIDVPAAVGPATWANGNGSLAVSNDRLWLDILDTTGPVAQFRFDVSYRPGTGGASDDFDEQDVGLRFFRNAYADEVLPGGLPSDPTTIVTRRFRVFRGRVRRFPSMYTWTTSGRPAPLRRPCRRPASSSPTGPVDWELPGGCISGSAWRSSRSSPRCRRPRARRTPRSRRWSWSHGPTTPTITFVRAVISGLPNSRGRSRPTRLPSGSSAAVPARNTSVSRALRFSASRQAMRSTRFPSRLGPRATPRCRASPDWTVGRRRHGFAGFPRMSLRCRAIGRNRTTFPRTRRIRRIRMGTNFRT